MIKFDAVTKRYGKFEALSNFTVEIERGKIFGLVGANGAGKSTAFSLLATLLVPTSGDILVDGQSVMAFPDKVREKIGYMPDFFGVYDQLKSEEYLDFYGAAYGLSAEQRNLKITELLKLVRLTDKRFDYVDHLSRGMKQRLCLARALMHEPDILILDEPASGLDPRARVEMRDILKDLKVKGITVLISSHILPELAELCDEIGVIAGGKLIAHGDIQSIQAQLESEQHVQVKVIGDLAYAEAFFVQQFGVEDVNMKPFEQKLSFRASKTEEQLAILLKNAIEAGIQVCGFEVASKNLEDVFMAITKEADSSEVSNT